MPGAAHLAKTASKVARASGSSSPVIFAHAVGLLFTDAQRAASGPVDVAEVAVGVHQRHQPVGGLA